MEASLLSAAARCTDASDLACHNSQLRPLPEKAGEYSHASTTLYAKEGWMGGAQVITLDALLPGPD